MPQVTVYIRKEDLAKWEAIEKKSEFIHNALGGGAVQKKQATVLFPKIPDEIVEVGETEEDYLDSLVLDTRAGAVYDTHTGERVEASPEMVKELKRRGQVQ